MENGPFIYRKENGRYKPIFGTKGTTIIFNANKLLHSATPALNGRKALDLVIAPSIDTSGRFHVCESSLNVAPSNILTFPSNTMRIYPNSPDFKRGLINEYLA